MTSSRRGSVAPWTVATKAIPASAAAQAGELRAGAAAIDRAPPGRARSRPLAILVTARPRQWVKNLLVIAAAGAAGAFDEPGVPLRVGLAFIGFCLISAGIYAINDAHDVAEDRLHPRKRFRPMAAGELSVRDGIVLGFLFLASGLGLCLAVRPLLGLVAFGYVALTLSYTLLWRHVPVVDIVVVTGGFVLRALAGGVAAPVTLSRWFVLVVTSAALFIAAGKRHAELLRTSAPEADPGTGRRVMRHYSQGGLRLLLAGSAGTALFAYAVWAFAIPDIESFPWRVLTVIPFTTCLLRYAALIRRGGGEAPEEMVLTDRILILGGAAWLLLFALSAHAAG